MHRAPVDGGAMKEGRGVSGELPTLERVRAALRGEARIRPSREPINLELHSGTLTMEGEVDHIAAKMPALEVALAKAGVVGIVDRLRVHPQVAMGDGEVRDRLRDVLLEDGDLADCTIRTWVKGVAELVHQPPEPTDRIDIRVDDGVVTLDGDVVNGIGVTPPEEDGEAGMTDAVVRVLEKDLFVDAASTRVHSRRDVVTLDGTVLRDAERKLREDDPRYLSAWTGW